MNKMRGMSCVMRCMSWMMRSMSWMRNSMYHFRYSISRVWMMNRFRHSISRFRMMRNSMMDYFWRMGGSMCRMMIWGCCGVSWAMSGSMGWTKS